MQKIHLKRDKYWLVRDEYGPITVNSNTNNQSNDTKTIDIKCTNYSASPMYVIFVIFINQCIFFFHILSLKYTKKYAKNTSKKG